MTEPRYTPGPWRTIVTPYATGHRYHIVHGKRSPIAATMAGEKLRGVVEANAHLIAAAPCMASFVRKHAAQGDQEAIELWERINGRR